MAGRRAGDGVEAAVMSDQVGGLVDIDAGQVASAVEADTPASVAAEIAESLGISADFDPNVGGSPPEVSVLREFQGRLARDPDLGDALVGLVRQRLARPGTRFGRLK